MTDRELVTVVIPAHNEERSIGACLDSIRAQDYPHLQVVVVDSASTDRTPEVVRSHMRADDRIELVQNPRRNIPSSLNLGLSEARGRWFVRVDAHSTVGPSYVRTAVERLTEGTWAGVGGRKDGVGRTSAGRAIAVALGSRLGVGNSTYHFGTVPQPVDHLPFGAYPVELLRRVGGWNDELVANEDFELDHRLGKEGGRLLFEPRMSIQWQCRQSIGDLFRQYQRYGKGKVDVVWLHPASMSPRHVVPPAFVAYAALGLLLSARRPARWAALMTPYAAAVMTETVRVGRQLDRRGDRLYLPPAFVAMHVGWGVGFWQRLTQTLPRHMSLLARTRRPAASSGSSLAAAEHDEVVPRDAAQLVLTEAPVPERPGPVLLLGQQG